MLRDLTVPALVAIGGLAALIAAAAALGLTPEDLLVRLPYLILGVLLLA